MAQGEPTNLATMEAEALPQNPFLSLFNKFFVKPQQQQVKNAQEKKVEIVSKEESVKREEGSRSNPKPDVVKFPIVQPEVQPIKVESEEAEKDTNPIVLWQVYALGGFIVLRWAWAKWQERKAKTKKDDSPGEENPSADPPAEDE